MIIYTSAKDNDLQGILDLQKANLAASLSAEEIASQGFVTVLHSYAQLKAMNDVEPHIIAKDGDRVIAYLLAMTESSQLLIPVLVPMFAIFGKVEFNGCLISSYNYIVVGQACVDSAYRGQGILDNCYAAYRDHFKNKYDFAITEIDATNLRSLKAHERIGFKEVNRYPGAGSVEWVVVLWDWIG